jgi:hypothetical protein
MEPSSNQNKLNWAILEYLSSARSSSSSNTSTTQSLNAAIENLQTAFGLSLSDESQKTANSSAPLDLAAAFSYALAHKDAAVAAAPKSSVRPSILFVTYIFMCEFSISTISIVLGAGKSNFSIASLTRHRGTTNSCTPSFQLRGQILCRNR